MIRGPHWRAMTLISAALVAGEAAAWVPGEAGLWRDGTVALVFDAADGGVDGPTLTGAAAAAIGAWNPHLQRVQLAAGSSSERGWYDNGHNDVFFNRTVYGQSFGGALAVTVLTSYRGAPLEADVVVNRGVEWAVYQGQRQTQAYDLRRVLVHELGHVLGLDHPDEAGQQVTAIMNSTFGTTETPTADDQGGVRGLYDRGAGAAPVILGRPRDVDAKEGWLVTFEVLAGGRGPLSYRWLRNGSAIPGASGDTLRIEAVQMAQAGSYSVEVRNAGGAVTSPAAQLRLTPAEAPFVSLAGLDKVVTAGSELVLSATVNRGDSPFRYEWKRNGVTLGFTDAPSFRIADVELGDAGDYTLTVTNIAGAMTTPPQRVSVMAGSPPRFTSDLPSRAVEAGGFVNFTLPGEASAPRQIQWQKDGVDIPGATSSNLALVNFQAKDVGNYTVRLSNAFGSATSRPARLVLKNVSGFQIVAHPTSVTEVPKGTATFEVSVRAASATYRWFKDGVLLSDPTFAPGEPVPSVIKYSGARSNRLRVSDLEAADAGVYTVEAMDGVSVAMSEPARLRVGVGKPFLTVQPSSHTVAPGGPVNLNVSVAPRSADPQASSTAGLTFQWFKDEIPVANAREATYRFNAAPADAGRYFVRVSSGGDFTDSEIATVTVPTGPAPLLAVQPPNRFVNGSNAEEVRLMSVALVVWVRRNLPGLSYVWRRDGAIVSTSESPFIPDFVPETYTLTVGRDGASETSAPFRMAYIPPAEPYITRHPTPAAHARGATVNLFINYVSTSASSVCWTKDGVTLVGATSQGLSIPNFSPANVGVYRATVSNSAGTATSEAAAVVLAAEFGPLITHHPVGAWLPEGFPLRLEVTTEGGALRYQWSKDGTAIVGATSARLDVLNAPRAASGAYTVVVSDAAGAATSFPANVVVYSPSRGPEILHEPASQVATLGGEVTLVVGADGAPPPDKYQWRKDGREIPGATGAKLKLTNVQADVAGSYTVTVANSLGAVTSRPAEITLDPRVRLVNLATRAVVGTGGDVLIAGFVLAGSKPRAVMVRGIGASLREFGVQGELRNPLLRIYDAESKLVASSDDWSRVNNDTTAELEAAARRAGAFPLARSARDSALIATLGPGNYTAQVSGVVDTRGVGLVEIYEIDPPSADRLINLSSRAFVGSGADILIPGFVLAGEQRRRLLVRAVGPGLANFGVGGALSDPVMTVFRGAETVARNDNWSEQPEAAQVADAMARVGAFALQAGSRDAALLLELPPGNYTVQVSGVNGATGIALVEVYEVTP